MTGESEESGVREEAPETDALAEAVNAVLDGTELDEALANAQAALDKK